MSLAARKPATVDRHRLTVVPPRVESLEELSDRKDVDLVHLVRGGSQMAFQILVERYSERIFRLVSRFSRRVEEVEDIVQDVFLKAFRKLDSFTFQASFYTWLYRIAINTATDAVNRSRRSPVHAVEDPQDWQDQGGEKHGSPDHGILEEELRMAARQVLACLPEKFRTILVLREYEDLSYDEIAQVLRISIGTVESRLFRARARFRDKMDKMFPGLMAG